MTLPPCITMLCGHQADAMTSDGLPLCTRCTSLRRTIPLGWTPPAGVRLAACLGRGLLLPTASDLPLLKTRPWLPRDEFYCGCWGRD